MHFDPDLNILCYDNVPQARDILSRCDGATQVNGYVFVPAILANLQSLRRLGLPVNPPMARYDWPICPAYRQPTDVQRVTSNFLVTNPRAFCLNDLGSMKTLSCLWAADFLMLQHPGLKCVVNAPLTILKDVWLDEINRNFLGRRKGVIVHGSVAQRLKALADDADFYIINTDGFSLGVQSHGHKKRAIMFEPGGVAAQIATREDIGIIIFDEGTHFRNASTKRHRASRAISGHKPYVWLLTGTPYGQRPTDAYGLAKLVNNAPGYHSFTDFENAVMTSNSHFEKKPRGDWRRTIANLLTPAVRFSIEECASLPPCYALPMRRAHMSVSQRGAYNELAKECCLAVEGGEITAANEAVLLNKLLQIACGVVYDSNKREHRLDVSPRLEALDELMSECEGKMIVYAPLTSVLTLLKDHIAKRGYSVEIMNGEVTQAKRNVILDAFKREGGLDVIVAHPRVASAGLNALVAAQTIIWYAPIYSNIDYSQAVKRIDRPGQTKVTRVLSIGSTDVEEDMYRRLKEGETLNGVILRLVNERRHQ